MLTSISSQGISQPLLGALSVGDSMGENPALVPARLLPLPRRVSDFSRNWLATETRLPTNSSQQFHKEVSQPSTTQGVPKTQCCVQIRSRHALGHCHDCLNPFHGFLLVLLRDTNLHHRPVPACAGMPHQPTPPRPPCPHSPPCPHPMHHGALVSRSC